MTSKRSECGLKSVAKIDVGIGDAGRNVRVGRHVPNRCDTELLKDPAKRGEIGKVRLEEVESRMFGSASARLLAAPARQIIDTDDSVTLWLKDGLLDDFQ